MEADLFLRRWIVSRTGSRKLTGNCNAEAQRRMILHTSDAAPDTCTPLCAAIIDSDGTMGPLVPEFGARSSLANRRHGLPACAICGDRSGIGTSTAKADRTIQRP